MNKSLLLFTILSISSIHTSDIEQALSHRSERDEAIEKLFIYLFNTEAPEAVSNIVKKKLCDSTEFLESLKRISTSSSSDENDPDYHIKQMVMQAIHEAFEEKNMDATDARLQLDIKEKEVRQTRYKFLLGAATAVTSFLGFIGTIVAYQSSGC